MNGRYKKTKKLISVCGNVIRIVLILFTLIVVGSWWQFSREKTLGKICQVIDE